MRGCLHQVEDREEEDPDQVDEVPEEAADFNTVGKPLRVRVIHLTSEEHVVTEDKDTADHVQSVETRDGEVDRIVSVPTRCEGGGEANLIARDLNVWEVMHFMVGTRETADVKESAFSKSPIFSRSSDRIDIVTEFLVGHDLIPIDTILVRLGRNEIFVLLLELLFSDLKPSHVTIPSLLKIIAAVAICVS